MRKIYLLTCILIIAVAATAYSLTQPNGKTLSTSKVKSKWGSVKFDASKFKNGNAKIKAGMAYSIMSEESKWIGKDIDEVFF